MYFLHLLLFPPWHHNGKWSITKHTLQAIEVPGSYMYACTLLPFNLLSTSGSPMSWVVPIIICTCIACLVPRPHALLDINYCVGLATKLCLSPCDCIALGQSCLVPKLPCADVALCQSCHVPMLPCADVALCQSCHVPILPCADVALCQSCHVPMLPCAKVAMCRCCLVPILPCADVALWPIVLCRCCLATYCLVPMLPCDLLSCAKVALWP